MTAASPSRTTSGYHGFPVSLLFIDCSVGILTPGALPPYLIRAGVVDADSPQLQGGESGQPHAEMEDAAAATGAVVTSHAGRRGPGAVQTVTLSGPVRSRRSRAGNAGVPLPSQATAAVELPP